MGDLLDSGILPTSVTELGREMENPDYETAARGRLEIAITFTDTEDFAPPVTTANTRLIQSRNYGGMSYLLYDVVIVVMYPPLLQLTQLKFQNKQSPFESHGFLTYTSVVAYVIAITTLILLVYMRSHLENKMKKRFYVILKIVFWFSAILASLSLVLVLLIPPGFNWIAYVVIFALFVIRVTCNFSYLIKLLGKKDESNLERGETSSSSFKVTISD